MDGFKDGLIQDEAQTVPGILKPQVGRGSGPDARTLHREPLPAIHIHSGVTESLAAGRLVRLLLFQ
jgi:hypothetical protein